MRALALLVALAGCSSSGLTSDLAGFEAESWSPPAFRADHVGLFADQGMTVTIPVTIEPDTTVLFVATRGGTGDADLSVMAGPDALCTSEQQGNDESCVVWDPPARELTIVLSAYTAFADVELDIEVSGPEPVQTPIPDGLVLVDATSDGPLDFPMTSDQAHGTLVFDVIPNDLTATYDIELAGEVDYDVTGAAQIRVPHPHGTDRSASTNGLGSPGGRGVVTWIPAPILLDEAVDGTTTLAWEPGAGGPVLLDASVGTARYRIRVLRAGFEICNSGHFISARCVLPSTLDGAYEVVVSGSDWPQGRVRASRRVE